MVSPPNRKKKKKKKKLNFLFIFLGNVYLQFGVFCGCDFQAVNGLLMGFYWTVWFPFCFDRFSNHCSFSKFVSFYLRFSIIFTAISLPFSLEENQENEGITLRAVWIAIQEMALCLIPSNNSWWRQRHGNSNRLSKQADLSNYCKRRVINSASLFRPQIMPSTKVETTSLRIFVVSDLHTDYPENMDWVRNLSGKRYKSDALLVAGDVAETLNNFVLTMSFLKDRFRHVFYVPGNHDLWCRREKLSYVSSIYLSVFSIY